MKTIIRALLPIILLVCTALPANAQTPGPGLAPAVTLTTPNSPNEADLSGCSRVDIPAVNADYEQEVVDLVNQNRWDNGQLAPLKRNPLLDLAARYHAKDMSDENYFEHDSYDGVGGATFVCSWDTRITQWYSPYNNLAENIAGGFSTPLDAVKAWMGSTGHRANILSTSLREIGVGYYTGSMWVQDFGSKSTVYPLVINREAAETSATSVNLYIYGDALQFPSMRFKNDGQDWGIWLPFDHNAAWTLRGEGGLRTVTVELRRANGTTVSASDDILLNGTNILGGVPDRLTFIYDQAAKKWTPSTVTFQPANLGGVTPLTWKADKSCGWISLNTLNGVSPSATLQVSVNVDTSTPGSYDGALTISVDNPVDTLDAPKVIPVHVAVLASFGPKMFLPFAIR